MTIIDPTQAGLTRENQRKRVISSRLVLRWKETDTGHKAKALGQASCSARVPSTALVMGSRDQVRVTHYARRSGCVGSRCANRLFFCPLSWVLGLKTPAELEPREQLCDTFHKASQGAASTQARPQQRRSSGDRCNGWKRTLGTALPASDEAVVRRKNVKTF